MIIINMSGGLGNQMFQYALYLKMKSLGKKAKLDTSLYKNPNCGRKLELSIFGIDLKKSNYTLLDSKKVKLENIFKKYSCYKDKIGIYQPEIFNMDNVFLDGYWQNEKYFSDIKSDICKAFTFSVPIGNSMKKLIERMEDENSVSLHVRRGDYVTIENQGVYGNICTTDYYERAIRYINENVENPHFYLFSDDICWVRENIYREGMTVIDINNEGNSYMDMFLMSTCRHHIIANSTFSWWGAWLGTYAGKIVVSPSRWFQNHKTTDIICKGWVRISGEK
jgi:hypothetical protein